MRIGAHDRNPGLGDELHAVNQFLRPDLAGADQRYSRRIDHDHFLGYASDRLIWLDDLSVGVECDPWAKQHIGERRIEMMVWIRDVGMVMLGRYVL